MTSSREIIEACCFEARKKLRRMETSEYLIKFYNAVRLAVLYGS